MSQLNRRNILTAATALPALAVPAVAAALAGSDAALIKLGREFDRIASLIDGIFDAHRGRDPREWTKEIDCEVGALYDDLRAIDGPITDLPAHTLEGMKVKARASFWWNRFEEPEEDNMGQQAWSIVRDLMRMQGQSV
jgi:hypothetical protein